MTRQSVFMSNAIACESARSKASSLPGRTRIKPVFALTALSAATIMLFGGAASALPQGANVVSGSATFNTNANQLTVTSSPSAIVNWQSFSVQSGARVQFNQAGAQSAILNRVIGQDPSSILGQISSNGRVFLINPNGIVFGAGSQINVAGLVASTRDIANADFLAGRNVFNAAPGNTAEVSNLGVIQSANGGSVYLIGQQVTNGAGALIRADNGQVVLAAGQSVSIVDGNNPQVSLSVTAPDNKAINLGQIIASGGNIQAWANQVRQAGQMDVSAVAGPAGSIMLKASGRTTLEGSSLTRANSASGQGGSIQVLGNEVGVFDQSSIQANGATGGGTVLVGGGWQGKDTSVQNARAVYMSPDASIQANATNTGNGGTVVLWSDEATRVNGSLQAQGGPSGGNGGQIETSSHQYLDVSNIKSVDTSAAQGQAGQWLLDPNNITIQAAGSNTNVGASPNFTSTNDSSIVTTGSIQTALNAGSSVTVQTSTGGTNLQAGDITWALNSPLSKSAGGDATLTLKAHRNIQINTGSNITSTSGKLNVVLNSDSQGSGSGWIWVGTSGTAAGSLITTNGGYVTMGGGTNPTTGYATNSVSSTSPRNAGVYIAGSITTNGGDVILNGRSTDPAGGVGVFTQGQGNTYNPLTNGTISAGSGNVSLNGDGLNGIGVFMSGGIQTTSGNITLNGTGQSSGVYLHVNMLRPGVSTNSGNIVINASTSGVVPLTSGTESYGALSIAGDLTATNGSIIATASGAGNTPGILIFPGNFGPAITARTIVLNATSGTGIAFNSYNNNGSLIVPMPITASQSFTLNAQSAVSAAYAPPCVYGTTCTTGSAAVVLVPQLTISAPVVTINAVNSGTGSTAPAISNGGTITAASQTITATNTGTGLAVQNSTTNPTTGVVTAGTVGSLGGTTTITGTSAGGQATASSSGTLLGTVILAGSGLQPGTLTPSTVVVVNGGLSATNLVNVTPAALTIAIANTPNLISSTPPAVIATLSPAQIVTVPPTQIAALSPAQVAAITPTQIAALSPAQVAAITPTQIAALSPAQVAAITPAQIDALTAGQIYFLYDSRLYIQLNAPAQIEFIARLQLLVRFALVQTAASLIPTLTKFTLNDTTSSILNAASSDDLDGTQTSTSADSTQSGTSKDSSQAKAAERLPTAAPTSQVQNMPAVRSINNEVCICSNTASGDIYIELGTTTCEPLYNKVTYLFKGTTIGLEKSSVSCEMKQIFSAR